MTSTLTTANSILKEVYEGSITDMLQNERVLVKRVENSTEGIFETAGGKYVVFPVRTKRNSGISYRAEGGALAAPGRQGYANTQETLKYGYGRIELTGQIMELAKTNQHAFAVAADAEMDGIREDLLRDQNRIVWGSAYEMPAGATGIITRVSGAGATSTINAPVPAGLEPGMIVDIVDGTGTPVVGGSSRTVVTAVPGATSFVVDAAVTSALNNNVVRTGNWNQEPHGLLGLIEDEGTLHNINSATAGNEYWQSYVDSATTTLTELGMIGVCDKIRTRGGGKPTAIFCSLGVRRAYFNLLTSMRRYNEPREWEGGLVGLSFNYGKEVPVVEDIDAPAGHMAFVNEKELKIYRNKDWHWADDDNSILKYVSGYDKWEAMMKCYWQFVTHKRNSHAKYTNITEPA